MIEETCWSVHVPEFIGGKGSAAERRAALCKAFLANRAPATADFPGGKPGVLPCTAGKPAYDRPALPERGSGR
jgi:hypothetical protein